MKTGRKILMWLLILLVVALVAVIIFLRFFIGITAKTAIEAVAPKITGTSVKVDSIGISVLTGAGTIKGFVMGNPEGYKTTESISVGKVHVQVDIMSLLTDTIVIKDITVEEPHITYEMGLGKSNIGKIQDNIAAFAGPKKEEPKPEAPKPEKPAGKGKKVIIEHFLLKDGKIALSATILQGNEMVIPLPSVEKRDIGKGGDMSPAQVFNEIFGSLSDAIEGAVRGAGDLIKSGANAVGEAGKGVLDAGKKGIKGLFGN